MTININEKQEIKITSIKMNLPFETKRRFSHLDLPCSKK